MERGTEQGHPLSPDLFKLFIRDLSSLFNTMGDYPYLNDTLVSHLLWADDLVLLAVDTVSLQHNIDILAEFCKTWKLEINLKKTKVVTFKHSKSCDNSDLFYLNNSVIEQTKSYCYLGIVFHESGNFHIALNELRKKALRAVYSLKNSIIKSSLSIRSLLNLFDSLIKPVLLYGCQVITPHNDTFKYLGKPLSESHSSVQFLKKIASNFYEKFHIKYLKWCLSVHPKASNIGCWGETGRYPICYDAIKLSIDYFDRVEALSNNSLLSEAYIEQKKLNLDWYNNITALKNMHPIHTYFDPVKNKLISIPITKNLRTTFIDKWNDVKCTSPKLEFYNKIKHSFQYESYLNISNHTYKTALSRFRISAHRLAIETGRYSKTNREDRFCTYCNLTNGTFPIENEEHVLLKCGLYKSTSHCILGINSNANPLDLIINVDKTLEYNIKAGRLISQILEINKSFDEFYTNNYVSIKTSTGNCALM